MPTMTASPGLVVDLLPQGSPGDPVPSPAVRMRRAGGPAWWCTCPRCAAWWTP
ncbi:MAG: hypothetical protein KKB13_14045 [Chloroflexi bacterium]|nr:hypothetical protein [Chloroflexota bacterium]